MCNRVTDRAELPQSREHYFVLSPRKLSEQDSALLKLLTTQPDAITNPLQEGNGYKLETVLTGLQSTSGNNIKHMQPRKLW